MTCAHALKPHPISHRKPVRSEVAAAQVRREPIVLALFFGAALVGTVFAPSTAVAASGNGDGGRRRLDDLAVRVQAAVPRPPRQSTLAERRTADVSIDGPAIERAESNWWLALLPRVRGAEPGLVDMLTERLEREDSYRHAKRVEGGFAARFFALVSQNLPSREGAREAEAAADALGSEHDKFWLLSTGEMPAAERAERRRDIHIADAREALRAALAELLGGLGPFEVRTNPVWKRIADFLADDARQRQDRADQALAGALDVRYSLRPSFFGAATRDDGKTVVTASVFANLESLERRGDVESRNLLSLALAPGVTPMAALAGDAHAYAATIRTFDEALIKALKTVSLSRTGASDMRVMDALYPIWETLDRQAARDGVAGNPEIVDRIQALVVAGDAYLRATSSYVVDDADDNDAVRRRIANSLDVIRRFRDAWVDAGRAPRVLYAAVEVDKAGARAWRPGGWLRWTWITPDELEDLRIDRRIVAAGGRQWLLPAGMRPGRNQTPAELSKAQAMELVVAIDPAGAWAGP